MAALRSFLSRTDAESLSGFPSQPRSRTLRQIVRWRNQLRRALGLRRGVKVGPFYYKELTADSLWRALSRKGVGYKDYRVTFPDGSKQVVRCTPRRVFADLMGPLLLARYRRAAHLIRPGSRLLDTAANTGYSADWLAGMTGPSGGVVAMERDEAAAAFARRRYPRENVGFETGGVEDLLGETDGAFDGVFCVAMLEELPDPRPALAELWRVVAPRGFLLVSVAAVPDPDAPTSGHPARRAAPGPLAFEENALRSLLADVCADSLAPIIERSDEGWLDAIVRKPADDGGAR